MINYFDEFDFDMDLLEQTEMLLESNEDLKPKEIANRASKEIINLFMHLLKYQFQPDQQKASWFDSVKKAHENIVKYKYFDNENALKLIDLDDCYQEARKGARDETHLSIENFPEERPVASKYSYYVEVYDTWDFDFIVNKYAIKQYLIDKYNPESRYNNNVIFNRINNW